MSVLSLPQGFLLLHQAMETWWVKKGWEHVFPDKGKDIWAPQAIASSPTVGGRGALYHLALDDGGQAIIRRYRRGGFVRHFIHDMYWDRPFRPFAELVCTEIARQRGTPTIEVLAAGVQRLRLGWYRGVFISRAAVGFINLWEWLHLKPTLTERTLGIELVAHAIAQLHKAGVFHVDLNLMNILVRTSTSSAEARIIDFDRARIFPVPLPTRYCHYMLRRFQRSLHKLDPQRQFTSSADETLFCRAYTQAMAP